ncbi:MAG: hypothetical protein HW421_122 [Ignavibacteria bacterium]|nr:hypothetical protein [Ignavibacteria bacterium]
MISKNSINSLEFEKNIKQCNELINKSRKFILTTHVNPDGDAIGSELAMYHFLLSIGKQVTMINYSPTPDNYKFLSGSEVISTFEENIYNDEIENADIIFVLDLNDSSRLKSFEKYVLSSKAKKIVIDHHLEPVPFADLYIVDSEACSTGEILYTIFNKYPEFKIIKDIASALYTAIMTDTGSFRFPRTDSYVHEIISELLNSGADPVNIYEEVYNRVPMNTMRLLGKAYASMELHHAGKLCLMTIPREFFGETQTNEYDVENFVEHSLSINGAVMGILITEIPSRSEYRLSFRSKGNISVRELALEFNGGGHFHAAGARIFDSDLNTTKSIIIEKANKYLSI